MLNKFIRTVCKLQFRTFSVTMFVAWMVLSSSSYAANLWDMLEREGDALDLMAMESVGQNILLVAAKYDQRQWQPGQATAGQMSALGPTKQLHITNITSNEHINWQRSYPALPEVNEIFSVNSTSDNQMCIAYGRQYSENEFINPVVLQVAPDGKIVWANTRAIPRSSIELSSDTLVQIANLDSVNIVDSVENGCALAYIVRYQTAESESFQIQLLHFDESGNLQWRFSQDTDLYGKMFLIRDKQLDHFIVVQTNQSRDAAIAAMMAAKPFTPHTDMLIVSNKGKLIKHHEKMQSLSKVWVKHIVDAPGDRILLAGQSKTAWVGFIDSLGVLSERNNTLEGEFSYANLQLQQGIVLVQNESLVAMDDKLKTRVSKPISQIVKNKHSNAFLEAKLPEQVPIQNIVPLENQNYLILYKLGSKLLKVKLGN